MLPCVKHRQQNLAALAMPCAIVPLRCMHETYAARHILKLCEVHPHLGDMKAIVFSIVVCSEFDLLRLSQARGR